MISGEVSLMVLSEVNNFPASGNFCHLVSHWLMYEVHP